MKLILLKLNFRGSIPIAINNKQQSPLEILNILNEMGGKMDWNYPIENRLIGMKSRGVYKHQVELYYIQLMSI